jgi:hypothetical protein
MQNPPGENISYFYTPIDEAVKELHQRRKSPGLLNKVRSEISLPSELEVLFERPHLVFFRQVLTPLNETLVFFELAKKYKLTPFVIEYYKDKFVSTGNQFKRGLGKLPIYQFTTPGGTEVFEYKTIVDFNSHVGHELGTVVTKNGGSLIKVHHDLFFKTQNIQPMVISRDGSNWFKRFENSHEYYQHFLKLFLRDNILFETFLEDGPEYDLTYNTVKPAFDTIHSGYGMKPLITMATYEDKLEDDSTLNYYPKVVADILNEWGYIK